MSNYRHNRHLNSIESFIDGKPMFTWRQLQILDVFNAMRKPMTDREVMNRCYQSDMNYVRPRLTELLHHQVLEECGRVKCPITGKMVRELRIKPRPSELPQAEKQKEFAL